MQLAFIGFPQSGKTTVFQALAGTSSASSGDPQKPHLAVLTVEDERLRSLSQLAGSKKVTFGQFTLLDSPLLTAHPEKDLNFAQVREADGFLVVIDHFSKSDSHTTEILCRRI